MLDLGLLILRVMAGGLLLWLHGWGKAVGVWKFVTAGQAWGLLGVVKSMGFPVPGLWAMMATMAESAGAFLVVIGLLARWSAAAIAINMMVAMYFHYTRGEGAEMAALYLAAAAAVALCGPGRYSLDEKGTTRRKRR
jgi:putative oxidoreductase